MTFPIERADEYFETLERRFQPQRAEGVNVVFQLNLTGPGGREAHIIVRDGRMQLGEGRHPSPDLTLETDADTWVRLANGTAHTQLTYLSGKLTVKGDMALTMLLRKLFPRYRAHHSDYMRGEFPAFHPPLDEPAGSDS